MIKYLSLLILLYTSVAYADLDVRSDGMSTFGDKEFKEYLVIKSQDQLVGHVAPPSSDGLRLLKLDHAPQGFDVYLDFKSISVGEFDGVIRYWLVYKTPSGAYNADYEGMQCHRKEYQIYAFANKAGKVTKLKNSQWQSVHRNGGNDLHIELKRDSN